MLFVPFCVNVLVFKDPVRSSETHSGECVLKFLFFLVWTGIVRSTLSGLGLALGQLKNVPFFRYKGWFDAWHQIWRHEGVRGFFRGALPRVLWFVPASAVSFMAVEWLRKEFNTQTTVHIDSQSVHPDDSLSGLSSQAQIDSIRVKPAAKQEAFEP